MSAGPLRPLVVADVIAAEHYLFLAREALHRAQVRIPAHDANVVSADTMMLAFLRTARARIDAATMYTRKAKEKAT